MKKITFIKMMLLAVAITAGSVVWGQTEVLLYETGFEASEGFETSTSYKNTEVIYWGPADRQWGTIYGAPSTENAISGEQSILTRWHEKTTGRAFTDFDLPNITKVEFLASVSTTLIKLGFYVKKESDSPWELVKTFNFKTKETPTTYTCEIPESFRSGNMRILFFCTYSFVTPGSGELYIDDVKIYGDVTEPTIFTNPSSLDFGDVMVGDTATAQTVSVTGANLTGAPTYSLKNNNTDFIVTGELTAEGGTLNVAYAPTAGGESTDTLTIIGDGKTATVPLSGTGVMPPLPTPVATEATERAKTSFTANWEPVEGATGYKLYVYTKATDTEGINETFTWSTNGTGGNDGKWDDTGIATATSGMAEDLPGWDFYKAYKGDNCIKIGIGTEQGYLTTPALGFTGDAVLTFRAGAWTGDKTELKLKIINGGDTLDLPSVTMEAGAFTEHTVNITGVAADSKIIFIGFQKTGARFFLDDVVVVPSATPAPAPRQNVARPYRVNPATDTEITGSPFDVAGGTTTTYNVTGLDNTQAYYYSVTAYNDTQTSAYSNEIGPIALLPTDLLNAKLANVDAWAYNGKVMVHATAGEAIEIFNVAGQKVLNRLAIDGLNEVPVQLKGVAIVKVGNRVSKVIL